jgi:DNA-binding response OmpR family regulator
MAKKILIVDDEKDVLLLLEKGLIAEGYSVITADNGNDALVLARSERPDLIILDVLLPDVDGPEVNNKLKEKPETKDVPVIFLTGMFPEREEKVEGRVVAGKIMFEKPYDIEKLLTAIKYCLVVRQPTL